MIKINLKEGFYVVPYKAVTLNGIHLEALNTRDASYEGPWALVCPNGIAVDNAYGRPYYYLSIDQAKEDVKTLLKIGECSYCGGGVWKRRNGSRKPKPMGLNTLRKKTIKVLNQVIRNFYCDSEFLTEVVQPFIDRIKQDIQNEQTTNNKKINHKSI